MLRNKRSLQRTLIRLGLISFTLLALGPVLWGVVTSLYPLSSLTSQPPDLNPTKLTLENYVLVFDTSRIMREEQEMANWLEQTLPMVTRQHLQEVVRK